MLDDRPADIRIAVALIISPQSEMLLVRKQGTDVFIQPGGKIDPGETPLQALVRELKEELDLNWNEECFRALGTFRDMAANESGKIVEAEAYVTFAQPVIKPQAEIEDVKWLPIEGTTTVKRAALSENQLFPLAAELLAERTGMPQ